MEVPLTLRWTIGEITDRPISGKQLTTSSHVSEDHSYITMLLNINGFPLTSIYGSYNMTVSENAARFGSRQSFVTVVPRLTSGEQVSSLVLYSAVVVTPVSVLDIGQAHPSVLQIRETTTLQFELDILPGRLSASYVKVYLPANEKNDESKMHVMDMVVDDVKGVSGPGVGDELLRMAYSPISRSLTSEADMATLTIPEMNVTNHAYITMGVTGLLLDFNGYKDGKVLEICVGAKLSHDVIWIGRRHVTIQDSNWTAADLVPNLDITLMDYQRYVEKNKVLYRLRLSLSHNDSSLASAYDISAFLYLPPQLTLDKSFKKVIDVIKPYTLSEDDGKVHFNVKRMSFAHTSRLVMNLTLDTSSPVYTDQRTVMVVYDVVYRGWRRKRDHSEDLQYLQIPVPEFYDDTTPPVTSTCRCPRDPARYTCMCCRPVECRCPARYGDMCVSCQNMWKCLPIHPEFYLFSKLADVTNGGFWMCNNTRYRNVRRREAFTSCIFASDSFDIVTGLSSTVATILGQEMTSGHLYGISNTGIGYVYSNNNGLDWMSIPERIFVEAISGPDFRKAVFN